MRDHTLGVHFAPQPEGYCRAFVNIPKCMSTTMKEYFKGRGWAYIAPERFEGVGWPPKQWPLLPDTAVVAIVRDPWQRYLSAHAFEWEQKSLACPEPWERPMMDFLLPFRHCKIAVVAMSDENLLHGAVVAELLGEPEPVALLRNVTTKPKPSLLPSPTWVRRYDRDVAMFLAIPNGGVLHLEGNEPFWEEAPI
jgi:hypothetical protein